MYDLPSEDPKEPGLPDEFHDLQPQLLTLTCSSRHYPPQQMFTGSDLNLYYDVRHPLWYKRPDWFLAVGVPRLYDEVDLRLSYVLWQEGISPLVVVEFLSPGTAKEDLGENVAVAVEDEGRSSIDELGSALSDEEDAESNGNGQVKETPPKKWEVYERILRVPYYIVFSRYTNHVRFFQLVGGHYQEQELPGQPKVWISELELGLGLWQGEYQGIERLWLRWYDAEGNWVLTETEQERQEKELAERRAEGAERRAEEAEQRAEEAEQRAEELAQRLRDLGVDL